jgi:hypothetical protein
MTQGTILYKRTHNKKGSLEIRNHICNRPIDTRWPSRACVSNTEKAVKVLLPLRWGHYLPGVPINHARIGLEHRFDWRATLFGENY